MIRARDGLRRHLSAGAGRDGPFFVRARAPLSLRAAADRGWNPAHAPRSGRIRLDMWRVLWISALRLDTRPEKRLINTQRRLAMMAGRKSFGALVRREREAKEIGLREMAKKIGVSSTYLSKIERGDFDPPVEDKVRKIAEIIGRDPDELLALAGRVASDLTDIIRQRPREMADFLRAAKGLTAEEMARLARQAQKAKEK